MHGVAGLVMSTELQTGQFGSFIAEKALVIPWKNCDYTAGPPVIRTSALNVPSPTRFINFTSVPSNTPYVK